MSQNLRLGPFRGLMSATGGNAPLGCAGSLLNVQVGDGRIRPRYGFRNLAAAPAGFEGGYGISRLLGYGDDYAERLEWVTVEQRSGVIKPYSVNPVTWARTEITNGGTPLSLDPGKWRGFSFDGNSYWILPGGSPSLYLHEIGNNSSWTALEDTAYVEQPEDPTLRVDLDAPYERPFAASTDTVAVSGAGVSSPTNVITTEGKIEVSGNAGNNTQDSADSIVTVTFSTPQDFSVSDYQGLKADGGLVYIRFKTGVKLEFYIGGVWVTPEQKPFLSVDRTVTGVVVCTKNVTDVDAVEKIRFTVRAEPQPHKSGLAYTVSPYMVAGAYLGADDNGDRAWDETYAAPSITYGVRYRELAGGTNTGIKSATLDGSRFGKYFLDNDLSLSRLGDRVTIEVEPLLTGGYADDPAGTSYVIDYLRMDQDGHWRKLGTLPNTTGQSWRDVEEEHVVEAITPEIPPDGYTEPEIPPVFSSSGLVYGLPFKGWVIWFRKGGKTNIRHSRVGDPVRLASPDDDTTSGVQGNGDEARGADFTLADNFADEPFGGVQAGDAVLVAGREGVYGQSGNAPYQMTPPRKIPGSMGCAGPDAFARFRDDAGNPGMAWLDVSGENVWFASAGLFYSTDTQARPQELSASIRGSLRTFLYEEQRESLTGLSLYDAQLAVDEATNTLWVMLGQRAAILRPPSLIDGRRQWELYRYALGTIVSGGGVVEACSEPFGATTGSQETRTAATLNWTNPNNVLDGAGVASVVGIDPGEKAHWLRADSIFHITPLPAEATLTDLTIRVRHRNATTDGEGVKLASLEIYNGAILEETLAGTTVPGTMTDVDFVADASNFDIAALNGMALSARLGYDAVGSEPFDPGDWIVAWTPLGTQNHQSPGTLAVTQAFAVTGSYIGAGTPPARVNFSITGRAYGSGTGGSDGPGYYATNYTGTATVNNGLGFTDTGAIMAPTPEPPPTFREAVGTGGGSAPVIGGVATYVVEMTANVTVSPGSTQDAVAQFEITAASVVAPTPSTLEVESVLAIACFTVPGAETERSVTYLAFGPDRNLVWLRSSGHLDAAEWCPTCQSYIEGTNRDGGLPMPEGHWESARIAGQARRLTRVEVEREGYPSVGLVSYTDRNPTGVSSIAPASQRWARFGITAIGTAHRVRVKVSESLTGVEALDLVFVATAGANR